MQSDSVREEMFGEESELYEDWQVGRGRIRAKEVENSADFLSGKTPRRRNQRVEGDLAPYIRTLDRDDIDIDGERLPKGTRILADTLGQFRSYDDPRNRDEFRKNLYAWSDEAREELWRVEDDRLDSESTEEIEQNLSFHREFIDKIERNLTHGAVGKELSAPNRPFSSFRRFLLGEPKVRAVRRIDNDALSSKLIQDAELWHCPAGRVKGSEMLLAKQNEIRVYEVRWLAAVAHVVVAYLTPLQMERPGKVTVAKLKQKQIDRTKHLYGEWLEKTKGVSSPDAVVFDIGAQSLSEHCKATASGSDYVILWSPHNGEWNQRIPDSALGSLTVRNFLELLKPETREEKLSKIRSVVDYLLENGEIEGVYKVTVAAVKERTNYRESVIIDAFLDLQRQHGYILANRQGDLVIGKSDSSAKRVDRWPPKERSLLRFLTWFLVFIGGTTCLWYFWQMGPCLAGLGVLALAGILSRVNNWLSRSKLAD